MLLSTGFALIGAGFIVENYIHSTIFTRIEKKPKTFSEKLDNVVDHFNSMTSEEQDRFTKGCAMVLSATLVGVAGVVQFITAPCLRTIFSLPKFEIF